MLDLIHTYAYNATAESGNSRPQCLAISIILEQEQNFSYTRRINTVDGKSRDFFTQSNPNQELD